MKRKFFTLLSLLIAPTLSAQVYVSEINRSAYDGRVSVQEFTKTELIEKERLETASCQTILDSGNSTGDGEYEITKENGSKELVYCDMTTAGGGWQRVTGNDLLLNPNIGTTIAKSNGTVLDSEQLTRFRRIYEEGHDSLMHYEIYRDVLLPHLQASTVTRDYRDPLPTIPFEMKAIMHVGYFWTWASDSDTGRFYFSFLDVNNTTIPNTVIDTGNVNWTSNGTSRTWNVTVPTDATIVRNYVQCRRVSGSYCSARINYGTFTLNGDLPTKDDYILIK